MAIYYADFDLGTGLNDGTSAANAWQTMQRAVDGTGGTQPVAGDTVYCKGTDTLAANLDLDGASGGTTTGMVNWIGVSDLTPTNDGTRCTIDGGDTYSTTASATDRWYLENFEFIQMLNHGLITASSPDYWFFNNCSFNNNPDAGIISTQMQHSIFLRCAFYLNGADGVNNGADNLYILCSSHDNTLAGFTGAALHKHIIGCLIYDNGGHGIKDANSSLIMNNVVNGNTIDGVDISINVNTIIGNRITNHSGAGDVGLECNSKIVFHGWNYYEDNDGDNIQNATIAAEILLDGASTDAEDQADTNEGYTDLTDGAEDFSLRDDATSRRTAITIPTS